MKYKFLKILVLVAIVLVGAFTIPSDKAFALNVNVIGFKYKIPGYYDTSSNPPAGQSVSFVGNGWNVSSSGQPFIINITTGATYTASVTSPGTGWTAQSALCIDNPSCNNYSPSASGFSRSVTIPAGATAVTLNWFLTPPSTSGTITPQYPSCVIAANQGTCNVILSWNTLNPVGTSSIVDLSGTTYATGISGSSSFPVPYYSYYQGPSGGGSGYGREFDLYNNGQYLNYASASASCVSGTSWDWNLNKCVGATMSGTITPSAYSCSIALNQSACNVLLSWNTVNPIGVSAITATGMTTVNGNSGNNISFSVPYSSRTFYLYNNGQLLDNKTVSASCTSGTSWNGSKCAAAVMSGTITPANPSCVILANQGTCNVTLSSDTVNPVSTSAIVDWGGTTYATGNHIVNISVPVPYYTYYQGPSGGGDEYGKTFELYNNSQFLYSVHASASCTSGTSWSWNLNICIVNPIITANAVGSGTIAPSSQQVTYGNIGNLTITPNSGYNFSIGGTCPLGYPTSGSGLTAYTTGTITSSCSVTATFSQNTYTVTGTVGANGSISPATRSNVAYGSPTTFIVTPNPGYTASASGCGGTLAGSTYTTGPITSVCTVTATFSQSTYTISGNAGAGGSISPALRNGVTYNSPTTFTVTPNPGYTASASGCGGTLAGSTYTTGPITSVCTVTATFSSAVPGACSSPADHLNPCSLGTAGTITSTPTKWTWYCTHDSLLSPQCSENKTPGYIEN